MAELDSTRPGGPASLVFVNGTVAVCDGPFTIAEAVAVRGDRVLRTGTTAEIEALAGPDCLRVDLRGRGLLPGLSDTHCHFEEAGTAEDTVSFAGVTSVPEALARIREAADRTPPGEWIRGRTWHPPSQLRERRYLPLDGLDAVSGARPLYLPMGHSAQVNSRALLLAGIDRTTPDPVTGTIVRDAGGAPTGVLDEAAERLVSAIVPPWPADRRARQLERAMATANGLGLTSVVGGAVAPADVGILRRLRDEGRATLRVGTLVTPTGELNPSVSLADWDRALADLAAGRDADDAWVRDAGVKLQVDGGMTLRTAATREPYPHDAGYHGELLVSHGRLRDLVLGAARHGLRVGVHAVGDAAIDLALDAFETADRVRPIRDRRFQLIHASLIRPDQMRRARRLGVLVAVQNVFLWDKAAAVRANLGEETAARAVPARTLIDEMGVEGVTAGTDYPINPLDPLTNLYVMTTRKDVDGVVNGSTQAISRAEAIRLYTSSAARYTFDEDEKGSLEPGRLADLVVLSQDVLRVADEDLLTTKTDITVVGGKVVHDRMEETGACPARRTT